MEILDLEEVLAFVNGLRIANLLILKSNGELNTIISSN